MRKSLLTGIVVSAVLFSGEGYCQNPELIPTPDPEASPYSSSENVNTRPLVPIDRSEPQHQGKPKECWFCVNDIVYPNKTLSVIVYDRLNNSRTLGEIGPGDMRLRFWELTNPKAEQLIEKQPLTNQYKDTEGHWFCLPEIVDSNKSYLLMVDSYNLCKPIGKIGPRDLKLRLREKPKSSGWRAASKKEHSTKSVLSERLLPDGSLELKILTNQGIQIQRVVP